MLQLKKPLAFIDIEATGTNVSADRIVEIAIVKLLPDGNRSVKRKIVNPQIPIPQVCIDMHGITNEMVKDAPVFKQVAQEIKQFLNGCDLSCYNAYRLDIPLLMEEFIRAEVDFENETFVMDAQATGILPWDPTATAVINLVNTVTANSTKPLFLALGIEFYQEVNGQMYPLKNGAYNALSLVKVSGL